MSPPPSQAPGLTDLRVVLRRRIAVVLVGALAGIALGFVVAASLDPPTPTATVGVEVLPTGVDLSQASTRGPAALDIDRAVVRMTSQPVLSAAADEFGATLPVAELVERTEARQLNDAPLVELSVTHPDPVVAVAAADAIAEAYLALEATDAARARDERTDALEAELDDTRAELGALGGQLGASEDPARIAALQAQQDVALRRVTELERAVLDLRALNVEPGRIARPAEAAPAGRLLGEAVAVPATTALGLLLGLGAALVIDRNDRRLWEPEDVTRATGSTAVVRVPRADLAGDGLRRGGGHRRLRTLVAPVQLAAGSVLVTGASADHGSGIAAGLAVAIAASGRRTVLVDAADADAFGLPGGDLDAWLAGRTGLDRAARSPDGVTSLQVLHGSPQVELSASATLRELLASPQALVVIHAPGGSESGDALALAPLVDRVVVVAVARQDRAETLARTHRWLARDTQDEPVVVLAG